MNQDDHTTRSRTSVYDAIPGERPSWHLRESELIWFELDASPFVEFVRRAATDTEQLQLAKRLEGIQRAAWKCSTVLVFDTRRGRRIDATDPIQDDTEEIGFDLDREGTPLGVEFMSRDCESA